MEIRREIEFRKRDPIMKKTKQGPDGNPIINVANMEAGKPKIPGAEYFRYKPRRNIIKENQKIAVRNLKNPISEIEIAICKDAEDR